MLTSVTVIAATGPKVSPRPGISSGDGAPLEGAAAMTVPPGTCVRELPFLPFPLPFPLPFDRPSPFPAAGGASA